MVQAAHAGFAYEMPPAYSQPCTCVSVVKPRWRASRQVKTRRFAKAETMDNTPSLFRRGYLPVLAGAVCISFAAFFVKGSAIHPSAIAFYRLFFGMLALFIVAVISGARLKPDAPMMRIITLAGLFFCGDLLSWHESIVIVGPGIATILTNFQVIILAFYDALVLKSRIRWQQYLAIPVALVGLALLMDLHEEALPPGALLGAGYGLLSAFFYSCYIVTLRRTQCLPNRLPAVSNIAWVSLMAATFVGLFCVIAGIPMRIPDVKSLVAVASLGIFCQSLGWLLLSTGLPHLTPFRAGFLMLLQPALSFIWDMLIYGTATKPINILGAVLALVAIGLGMMAGIGKDARCEKA